MYLYAIHCIVAACTVSMTRLEIHCTLFPLILERNLGLLHPEMELSYQRILISTLRNVVALMKNIIVK